MKKIYEITIDSEGDEKEVKYLVSAETEHEAMDKAWTKFKEQGFKLKGGGWRVAQCKFAGEGNYIE